MDKEIQELMRDKIRAKTSKNYKELAGICNYLGKLLSKKLKFNEALSEHNEELQICGQLSDCLGEAIAYRAIGECYSDTSQYDDALKALKQYLSIALDLDNKIEIQRAFATIGRTYLLNAQDLGANNDRLLDKAEQHFNKALDLCDRLKEDLNDREYQEMRSRLFLNLGLVFDQRGDIRMCSQNFQKSIFLNKKYGFKEDLQRCHIALAAFYERMKQFEMSSRVYDEAIKTSKELKNRIYICDALYGKAMVMIQLEDFEGAKHYLKRAYKCKSPAVEDHEKAERYMKIISLICDDLTKLDKAEQLDHKIELCDKLGDHFVAIKCFNYALKYYKKQLEYARVCGKPDLEMAKIYVSIAQTYVDDGQLEEALNYFNYELDCYSENCIDKCKTLLNVAYIKEKLSYDDKDVVLIYESILEMLGNRDNLLLTEILNSFSQFLEKRSVNSVRLNEIKILLKDNQSDDREENSEEEEFEELDFYDNLDANDFCELTSDSDSDEETIASKSRVRQKRTKLKLNEMGETPLHRASIEGKLKVAERLIETGHPISVRDYCGWTPLHEAVNHGFIEIAMLLINSGANINDRGGEKCDGITPLHDACNNGQISIARILVEKGADITLLTENGETPLDCLKCWKKRCASDNLLSDEDRRDYQLFKCQLEEEMNRLGFTRETPKGKNNNNNNKRKRPITRTPDSSPEISFDDVLQSSQCSERSCSPIDIQTTSIDIDKPGAGRREYRNTMENLRRQRDPNSDLFRDQNLSKPKKTKIPALLNEEEYVRDNWLINDCRDDKKRSVKDLYDSFGPTNSNFDITRRKTAPKIQKTNTSNADECEILSDNSSENMEKYKKNNQNKENQKCKEWNKPSSSSSFTVRVTIEDRTLLIPIPSRTTTCAWLRNQVSLRYFSIFNANAKFTLETTDNAILFDKDCVADVINDNKVVAKIESYVMEAPHDRYKHICEAESLREIKDITKQLQNAHISGKLCFNNVLMPKEQIKPIFRAIQRHNNLQEIDISLSNFCDDRKSLFESLSLLPTLHRLNLKCTSVNSSTLEQLSGQQCPNLVEIDLSFNWIDDYCGDSISKIIRNFKKLNLIDLSACDFTNKLFENQEFIKSIKDSNLQSLILDYNKIDSDIIEKYKHIHNER